MSQNNLRADLKAKLDRETTVRLLEFIGTKVNRNFQFVDNPSFSISKNGLIKDFGSTAFSGDFISYLIDVKNVPYFEAIEWVSDALGVQP
jgi:hypothetical protein